MKSIWLQTAQILMVCVCAQAITNTQSVSRPTGLERGTAIVIDLKGIAMPQRIEEVVDQQGNISLPDIGELPAVGKSPDELAEAIETSYISAKIFQRIEVMVRIVPMRFFGPKEAKQPGIYPDFKAVAPENN